jgi:hypothetical protein
MPLVVVFPDEAMRYEEKSVQLNQHQICIQD